MELAQEFLIHIRVERERKCVRGKNWVLKISDILQQKTKQF